MKPTFVLRFTHEEMVVLMETLRYRFEFTENTRRAESIRQLTAFQRPVGNAIRRRISERFNQGVDLVPGATKEDLS